MQMSCREKRKTEESESQIKAHQHPIFSHYQLWWNHTYLNLMRSVIITCYMHYAVTHGSALVWLHFVILGTSAGVSGEESENSDLSPDEPRLPPDGASSAALTTNAVAWSQTVKSFTVHDCRTMISQYRSPDLQGSVCTCGVMNIKS